MATVHAEDDELSVHILITIISKFLKGVEF